MAKSKTITLDLDFPSILKNIEKLSPFVARQIVMKYLSLASPFNAHLKSDLQVWNDKKTIIKIGYHRSVKNHLGGIHAGALFTLGESCAGVLLIKNFSPSEYRLIMQSASVEYSKQARSAITGECHISQDKLVKIKAALKLQRPFFVPMETVIKNLLGETICVVKTKWQIKPWDQVRKK